MPRRWGALALVLAVVSSAPACARPVSDEHEIVEPATFEDGRITMTADAAARLDVQTEGIRAEGAFLVVPSSALLVEPDGRFYVYVSTGALVFVKEPVRLGRDDGGNAFLRDGPPAGTDVVTVGVPELYGIEYGMGH